jgi:N-acetylneuraminic acid mutarotase
VALLLAACGGGGAADAWSPAPPLVDGRAAHAVVGTGSVLYALAGTGADSRPVLDVERFDGTGWTVETTLPVPDGLNAPAAAFVDGRIYVIGGFGATSNRPVADVHVYDLATHEWRDAAPLPSPRGGHAAAVVDGRIHVVGGGNAQRTLADHDVYDPATDAWTTLAPLPVAKGSPAAVVLEGALWVIGGRSGRDDFGDVDRYDAATDTWTPGPPIEPRGAAGAVVSCGTILVIGGEAQASGTVLADVLRLDPDGTAWTTATPMPTARVYARAVTLGDAVYVVGGSPDRVANHASRGLEVVERFDDGAC